MPDDHIRRVRDWTGDGINPATEEKQDSAITGLGNIEDNQTDRSQLTRITDGTDDSDVETLSDSVQEINGKTGLITLSAIFGRRSDSMVRSIEIDDSTHAINTIAYPHHEIHSGSHYYINGYTTLGNGGTLYVKLVTPSSARWGHFTWQIGSSGILTATLDEDATGGMAGGAVATIHANNRNVNCWT